MPLVIWTTGGRKNMVTPWGKAEGIISGTTPMLEAAIDLLSLLDQQWIAWVEGAWLPGEVAVSAAFEVAPQINPNARSAPSRRCSVA